MELRKESPARFFRSAWEKLDGVEGFEGLKNKFRSKFYGRWANVGPTEYEKMLQKTQAPEAEMRAAMELVDEYGREGH